MVQLRAEVLGEGAVCACAIVTFDMGHRTLYKSH